MQTVKVIWNGSQHSRKNISEKKAQARQLGVISIAALSVHLPFHITSSFHIQFNTMCVYEPEPQCVCVWYFAEPDLWFLQLISFLSVWVLYWLCICAMCIFFLHICAHLCMFVITFCSVCILFPVSMTGEHFMFAAGCSFGLSSKDWLVMQPNLSRSSFMTLWVCETSRAILPTVAESLSHPQTCLWVCACMHLSMPLCIYCMCVTEFLEISHPTRNNFSWLKEYYTVSVCMFVCMCALEEACACAFKQLLCCKQFLKHGSVCFLPALLSCFSSKMSRVRFKMDHFNAAHAHTQKHQASNMKAQETCKHIHTY